MIKKCVQLAILFVVLSFFMSGIVFSGSSPAETKKTVSVKIATATRGGTFYPVGVALSELWNMKLKNHWINPVEFTAVSSAGSEENIKLLKENKVDMAILQGLSGSLAWDKTGLYRKKAYRGFRAVSNLWPNVEHFVLAKSKVKTGTITDIKGTRFSIGRPDSGTEESTLIIMNAFDMGRQSIIPSQLGYEEAVAAIKKGELDGASLVGGTPVKAVQELFSDPETDVAVLEFSDKQLNTIINRSAYPGFRYVIFVGTYPGQKRQIKTVAQTTFLAVRADINDELVYKMTETIYKNLAFLLKKHRATRYLNINSAVSNLPVPLHPGAIKYYKEAGLEIPKDLIP